MKYQFKGITRFSIDDFECEVGEDGTADVPFDVAHSQEFRSMCESLNAREEYAVILVDATEQAESAAAPVRRGRPPKAKAPEPTEQAESAEDKGEEQ